MRILINGTETFYQKIGKGPNIVLLHGWGCDWQIWAGLIPPLSDHYQLVIPDLPGFGQTKAKNIEQWNAMRAVEWLEEFLEKTIPGQSFTLVGHSFGGKIAAVFSATSKRKNDVEKLILIDSAGIPGNLTGVQKMQKNILHLIPTTFKKAFPHNLKKKLLTITKSSTDYESANEEQKKLLRTVIAEDIRPVLSKVIAPTSIFWGKNDTDTPIKNAYEFHKIITHSKLILFDTGHFPFIDQRTQFLEKLRKEL